MAVSIVNASSWTAYRMVLSPLLPKDLEQSWSRSSASSGNEHSDLAFPVENPRSNVPVNDQNAIVARSDERHVYTMPKQTSRPGFKVSRHRVVRQMALW
jgi:hypothetical protein